MSNRGILVKIFPFTQMNHLNSDVQLVKLYQFTLHTGLTDTVMTAKPVHIVRNNPIIKRIIYRMIYIINLFMAI